VPASDLLWPLGLDAPVSRSTTANAERRASSQKGREIVARAEQRTLRRAYFKRLPVAALPVQSNTDVHLGDQLV
jgi:phage/plasmid primase-like uncharacterized protein